MLAGDDNGNINDAVDTDRKIKPHPGVTGKNDLLVAHDWDDPVAMIDITLVESASNVSTYDVTLVNLAGGQPLSPPVAATHHPNLVFQVPGTAASDVIEAIAENGDQGPAVAGLTTRGRVTDVVDVGAPLTPSGVVIGDFTDTAEFEITGRDRDHLSLSARC